MNSRTRASLLLGFTLFFSSSPLWPALNCHAATVEVFAAASLTDSLKAIAAAYEKQSTDRIVFNFGASSTLERQIEEGAPADLFFSADAAKMDRLAAKGLLINARRTNLLSNSLVIVIAGQGGVSIESPNDLAGPKVKRLALGNPAAVPIGVYSKIYLRKLGLWDAVAPKVVATENVRAALAAVEAGDADAAIVYQTDAAISKQVKVAFAVPPEAGPRITYPAALLKDAPHPAPAKRFLEYLASEPAWKIFREFGFRKPS
ncbi:molybdate transporter subunit; periplasmic-binding component of ABC superfamily [Verrucomicrobia bacterium]|nr:molybdate transporter subunit; periplasmic-binding component of ABC superfamily [Verrucomicrobiota bacterium]